MQKQQEKKEVKKTSEKEKSAIIADNKNESKDSKSADVPAVKSEEINLPKIDKPEDVKPTVRELELESKRISKEISKHQEKLESENKKIDEWFIGGNRLLEENEAKFKADKMKNVLKYNEEKSIAAKNMLIEYYQSEIERLTKDRDEQEKSGKPGDFSSEFKQFLKVRSERYEKRKASLNKNWIHYTYNYRDKKVPVIEEKISQLKKDLHTIETKIAEITPKEEKPIS